MDVRWWHKPHSSAAIVSRHLRFINLTKLQPAWHRRHCEPDLDFGPEVRADQSAGLATRPRANRRFLEEDDFFQATASQVERDVRSVDAAPNNHRVGSFHLTSPFTQLGSETVGRRPIGLSSDG